MVVVVAVLLVLSAGCAAASDYDDGPSEVEVASRVAGQNEGPFGAADPMGEPRTEQTW
jgi:hypothetical protein